jgi:putative membrane-bound dehydrogenase-like protein
MMSMLLPRRFPIFLLPIFCATALLSGVGNRAIADESTSTKPAEVEANEPSTILERFPSLSPEEALAAFEVAPGFRVELVAAEPLVTDPTAFCFDPAGRLIVVEMRGYSERPDAMEGRVRRLSDRDGDGRMDHAETLVEGLSWPTAVECLGDGIVVAMPPDILFFSVQDDADGRAIVGPPEKWFTGFGRSNVQGMMNSFRWGPDLRLHGATSSNGGEVTGVGIEEPLRVGRQDFAIDPLDRSFHLVGGGGQHGMDFDAWGNKYATSNSDHLQQILMLPPGLQRSNRYADVPPQRRSIAEDGPAADVYRSSPVEPWRLLRTHLRVSGQVPGVVEGGGRAAGYFTGATGVHIYQGDQWPDQPESIALVCDVGGNLVHRKRLNDTGLWKVGRRIDDKAEFLRSPDTWFRPVQLGGGPDGAFYVADMYREVIEHPASLPPVIKSQVDLNSGNDRGRIWRVVADSTPIRRSVERLDKSSESELVEYLKHPNQWQRKTAARLLVERQADGSIEVLRELASDGKLPQARLEALAVLEHLAGGIDQQTVNAALNDEHSEVRRRGLQIAANKRLSLLPEQYDRLAEDESIAVRFSLAYGAAVLIPQRDARATALGRIAAQDPADPWIRWAVEGALGDAAIPFLDSFETALRAQSARERSAWYRSVCCQILNSGDSAATEQLVTLLSSDQRLAAQKEVMFEAVVSQLGEVDPQGAAAPVANWGRDQIAPDLLERAQRRDPSLVKAAAQMKLVGWADPQQCQRLLSELLSPSQSLKVQEAALVTLIGNDPVATGIVLERLPGLTPSVRQIALTTLSSRLEGQLAIARALEGGQITAESLSTDVKRLLTESRHREVRRAVEKHLDQPDASVPGKVYESYVQTLHQSPNLDEGKAVFVRVCSSCHQPPEGRLRVGPDLLTVLDQPKEQILLSILDPNREVDARYATVQVITHSGQIVAGVIASEAEDSVTLVDSQGNSHTVSRNDIDELQTSKKSLMPEELSKEINETQMRDLIGYLISLRSAPVESKADASR